MRPYLLLSFLFLYQFVNAQYKISGFIYDENNSLLRSTEVLLIKDQTTKSVKSDQTGKYQFTNLSNGEYQLILKKDFRKEVFNVAVEDQDQEIDIGFGSYTENESVLNDLVINIESVKSKLEKEGFAMNVIETKDAALRNIQTNELLDRTAGVRVRQNGGLGSSVEYNLNGMTGNSVRIFVDGIPISTYGSSFSLNSIPPALIERIEVYKGVIPIHLADDALGGAINVVLKKGVRNNFKASLSYGSFNTWQGNFNGMFRHDNVFTLKASSFYNFSDNNYEIWGKFARNKTWQGYYQETRAKRFNDAFRSVGGRIEAGFTDVKWADTFLLGFNGSESYKEIQHGLLMEQPYKGRIANSDAQVVSLNYIKKNILTKGLNFDFNGMISQRKQILNDTVKWRYNWDGEIIRGKHGEKIKTDKGAQQGAPTLDNISYKIATFRTGLSYEFLENQKIVINHVINKIERHNADELKPIAQSIYDATGHLEKNITSFAYEMKAFETKLKTNAFAKLYNQKTKQVNPRSVLIDGLPVKIDDVKDNKTKHLGYGIAASYLFTSSIIGLVSAEKAIRLPNETELFGDPAENVISNITLKPEVSNNLNIGVKLGMYKINQHKFSVSGTGFIRDTRDKVMRRTTSTLNEATQAEPFVNYGKTKAIGFEAEATYNFQEKLNIMLSLSRFKSLYNLKDDGSGKVPYQYKEQLPNEPFFTANGSVQYLIENVFAKKSQLFTNYNFGFVESFYTIQPPSKGIINRNQLLKDSETPRQFIQDIGLSYVFPNKQFVVSFDVKNVFNKQAFDNFAVQKPGRAFYLKLNYSFNKL